MAKPKKNKPTDNVRDIVLEVLAKMRREGGFATGFIADAFRSRESLGNRAREMATETIYGMISQSRRIDYALQEAHDEKRASDAVRYTAYRLLGGDITLEQAVTTMPRVKWDVVAGVDDRIALEGDPAVQLALRRSLPDWLARRMLAQFGAEADALGEALNRRAPLTLRVNTLSVTREELIEELSAEGIRTRAGELSPTAVIVDPPMNVFRLAAFREGRFEVQDEASQLVAEIVAPPPGSTVIDACAGAGGKTLAVAALMKGRGKLIAYDPDHKKLEQLKMRARRAQVSNLRLPAALDEIPNASVERVLVDAPCSGIGALRRKPEARWRIKETDLAELAAQQEQIARRAMTKVKPGGRLIYATCTVLEEENEKVVERLQEGSDFQIMPVKEILGGKRAAPFCDSAGRFLKMFPHKHNTDGFFAAVLRKKA